MTPAASSAFTRARQGEGDRWTRRHWQIAGAQFLCIRQFVEIAKTEMFEEELGGFVEQWTAWQFRAPADFHQAAFHQVLQDAFDSDTAHRFDIGAGDWLAISDDGEGFQRGRRKPRRFRSGKKLMNPACAIGTANQLPAAGFFDELESTGSQGVVAL